MRIEKIIVTVLTRRFFVCREFVHRIYKFCAKIGEEFDLLKESFGSDLFKGHRGDTVVSKDKSYVKAAGKK